MRNSLSIFIAFLSVILVTSCSGPVFNTVNNMRNINSTVYLKDGNEMNGQVSTTLSNSFNSTNYIQFSENGKDRKKLNVADIKAIRVRGDYYEPKLIDQGSWSRDQMLFVKRLTKEGSRIHLYELYEQTTRTTNNRYGNSTRIEDDYSYYVSLPGQDPYQAWNVEGRHLTPNFEDKMSEYVKDCSALAEKIKRKDKGYFYAKISLVAEKRIETMMTIIEEYNRCNQ